MIHSSNNSNNPSPPPIILSSLERTSSAAKPSSSSLASEGCRPTTRTSAALADDDHASSGEKHHQNRAQHHTTNGGGGSGSSTEKTIAGGTITTVPPRTRTRQQQQRGRSTANRSLLRLRRCYWRRVIVVSLAVYSIAVTLANSRSSSSNPSSGIVLLAVPPGGEEIMEGWVTSLVASTTTTTASTRTSRQRTASDDDDSSLARLGARLFLEQDATDTAAAAATFPAYSVLFSSATTTGPTASTTARTLCHRLDRLDREHYETLFVDCMDALERAQEAFRGRAAAFQRNQSRLVVPQRLINHHHHHHLQPQRRTTSTTTAGTNHSSTTATATAAVVCNSHYYKSHHSRPLIIHAMWDNSQRPHTLPRSALLGVLSFVLSSPHCSVQLFLWVTSGDDEEHKGLLERQLREYLPTSTFRVLPIDFVRLCTRIQKVHPALHGDLERVKLTLASVNKRITGGDHVEAFSDVVRMFVVAAYGGAYLDCDVILLRPLMPLLSADFFYQWSFTDYCNTAAMHVAFKSPNAEIVLRLAFRTVAEQVKRKTISSGRGGGGGLNAQELMRAMAYALHPKHLWYSLQQQQQQRHSIELLPSAYFDPLWIVVDTYGEGKPAAAERYGIGSFEDFFLRRVTNKTKKAVVTEFFFPGAFAYHFHNQWSKPWTPQCAAELLFDHFVRIGRQRRRQRRPQQQQRGKLQQQPRVAAGSSAAQLRTTKTKT